MRRIYGLLKELLYSAVNIIVLVSHAARLGTGQTWTKLRLDNLKCTLLERLSRCKITIVNDLEE